MFSVVGDEVNDYGSEHLVGLFQKSQIFQIYLGLSFSDRGIR